MISRTQLTKCIDARSLEQLLGDATHIKVIQEITADPYTISNTNSLCKLLGTSKVATQESLQLLKNFSVIIPTFEEQIVTENETHTKIYNFTPNLQSNILLALTLLNYAILDELEHTTFFNLAINDYLYNETINDLYNKQSD
jgi:hypothetical protein